MIKSYKVDLEANNNKLHQIRKIAKEYRKIAKSVLNKQLYLLFKNGKIGKNYKFKIPNTLLSARYLQTLQYQVVGMLESYLSNRQNDFKDIVLDSNLDEKTKIQLLYINKYKKWFSNEVMIKKEFISKDILKLARGIIKKTFKLNRLPNTNYIHLNLDSKVAKIETKQDNKAKIFDYWIILSTLKKGKTIKLPIKSNQYFEEIKGKLKNFTQIIVKDKIEVVFMKDVPKREYTPKTDKIALDLGLSNLFATNNGDLFGRRFIDYIAKLDTKIVKLQAELQKHKLKPKNSKRYRNLIHKLKQWIKNEVNRVLNKIIKLYKPKEIVIERLNFQSPKLSKKLNRLLQNFGKAIIKNKLQSLKDEFGIKITKINPAYTSQTCSNCGYISKRNRKTQSVFICEFCNKKQNSDINAAKNIFSRSSWRDGGIYIKKSQILNKLIKEFIERHKRVYSCPLIKSESYVGKYLQDIANNKMLSFNRLALI